MAQDEDLGLRKRVSEMSQKIWRRRRTYDSDGIEPSLDPAPNGREEAGSTDDEDPVQGLGIVRRRQLRSVLHMRLEIPKSRESNSGDIDNVAALADRRLGVGSIRHDRAQRQNETTHVLVQREESQHPRRFFGGCGSSSFRFVLLVCMGIDVLRVQRCNLEDVEWDAAFIASTRPLGIQAAGGFVLSDIDGLVEIVKVILLAPVLSVFELSKGVLRNELPGAEIAQQGLIVVRGQGVSRRVCRLVVALFLTQLLECVKLLGVLGAQMSDMSRRPLSRVVSMQRSYQELFRPLAGANAPRTYLVGIDALEAGACGITAHGVSS